MLCEVFHLTPSSDTTAPTRHEGRGPPEGVDGAQLAVLTQGHVHQVDGPPHQGQQDQVGHHERPWRIEGRVGLNMYYKCLWRANRDCTQQLYSENI